MLIKTFLKLYLSAFFGFSILPAYSATPQSVNSFESEFEWANAKNCIVPNAMLPARIWIKNPEYGKLPNKISVRRWMDWNGDGVCELFDIEELEESAFTQKIYGYPVRVGRYMDNKWEYIGVGVGNWFPLILLDRTTGEKNKLIYLYGNAGYSPSAQGVPGGCAMLRRYLAEGYMLNFRFPRFAKDDPVTDPNGDWNDIVSGWVSTRYIYREEILRSDLPSECKEKYSLVINALAKKLESSPENRR
jgi:hypothetical protein